MSTRAVRFSDSEEKKISDFLELNPLLDFSTLARISIMNFIENPEIKLNPIKNINHTNKDKIKNKPEVH